MSDDPTPLSLPPHLPYPLTLTRLLHSPASSIARGAKLLEYTFTSDSARRALARLASGKKVDKEDEGASEGDMVGSWESPVAGELVKWGPGVRVGMKVEKRHASRPVVYIQQACSHPVQLHGLCGICGQELNENDYLSQRPVVENVAGPSRFPGSYEMGHDSLGVTVSSSEAQRLDTQTRVNLLRSRRLSLIVDLDQTIIHTTVDPTVGEWLKEVEDARAGRTKRRNPNAEALVDVAIFGLEDDVPAGGGRARGADRRYFTKPRPGLPAFLEAMSDLYEMHVYTMGTRTYADQICRAIDPGGKIFGGRILSRDESGSFSLKNLKRLFPTDQSMVVVIDDRSDVWGDIPNLVKVVPYDFFIGIGDINSNLAQTASKKMNIAAMPTEATASSATSSPLSASSNASTPPPMTPPEVDQTAAAEEAARKTEMMDRVQAARPLAHMQEKLDEQQVQEGRAKAGAAAGESPEGEADGAAASGEVTATEGIAPDAVMNGRATNTPSKRSTTPDGPPPSTTPEGSPPPQIPLLNPHDSELVRVANILTEVHASYYAAYDAASSSPDQDELPMGCDVELIIPDLKSRVLEGCNIVFSGLIPRHIKAEQSEIWQLAQTFGARPLLEVSPAMTHCVTATIGTEKTHRAQRMGKWVVRIEWFSKCIAQWRRVDEGAYDCYPALKEDREGIGAQGYAMLIGDGTSTPSGMEAPVEGLLSLGDDPEEAPASAEQDKEEHRGQLPQPPDENGPVAVDILDDPDFGQGEWDAEADAEMDAWFEGTEDGASERGSVASPPSSIPGTPRKRVRYADEEDLPLSSFRDPPIKRPSFDTAVRGTIGESSQTGEGSGSESPPRKRKTPYLLPAPSEAAGEDTHTQRVELSEKQKERLRRQIEQVSESTGQGGTPVEQEEVGEEGPDVETEGEEEDEFARMLAESLG